MDVNTIVAERPAHGAYLNDQTVGSMYRVWLPFGSRLAQCLHWVNLGGYWPSWQLVHWNVGLPQYVKWFPYGSAAYSFPDGAWAAVTTGQCWALYRHLTYTPNRRLVWTADDAYDYVAINLDYWATFTDATLTLSGSGTLLRSTLDCHTAASPFKAHSEDSARLVRQRFVVVATGVQAGDTLTLRSADGGDTRVATIIGIKAQERQPAAGECLLLSQNILNADEPGLDAGVRAMQDLAGSKGITLALSIKDANNQTPRYWGTPQHTDANNTLTGAGGVGKPTLAFTYFDDANPNGAAWNPAVGGRLTARALLAVVTGEAKMFGYQAAAWEERVLFTPEGLHTSWRLVMKATAEANELVLVSGGYAAMLTLADGIGWVEQQGSVARTPLVLNNDAWTGRTHGRRLTLGGGVLRDALIEFNPYVLAPADSGRLGVNERATDNKLYHEYVNVDGEQAMFAAMVLGGGARIALSSWPAAWTRPRAAVRVGALP
jgi:hypothetical protein